MGRNERSSPTQIALLIGWKAIGNSPMKMISPIHTPVQGTSGQVATATVRNIRPEQEEGDTGVDGDGAEPVTLFPLKVVPTGWAIVLQSQATKDSAAPTVGTGARQPTSQLAHISHTEQCYRLVSPARFLEGRESAGGRSLFG